jgi:hypothetical protein
MSTDVTSAVVPGPVGSRIVTSTDELDLEISVAFVGLGSARGRFERCPSAENQGRIDEASAEVDRLLDQRLILQRPTST